MASHGLFPADALPQVWQPPHHAKGPVLSFMEKGAYRKIWEHYVVMASLGTNNDLQVINSVQLQSNDSEYVKLVSHIATLWNNAKAKAIIAVNSELLDANWLTGQYIVEFEQGGNAKAKYGDKLLINLSKDLTRLKGKGFSRSNLTYMRKLYLVFPKCETLSHQLTWSHYFELLSDEPISEYFKNEAMEGRSRNPRKPQRVHYVISHYVIKTLHNCRTGASNKKDMADSCHRRQPYLLSEPEGSSSAHPDAGLRNVTVVVVGLVQ